MANPDQTYSAAGTDHAIDLRLSLPLPGGRWYLAIVGNRERRDTIRLAAERRRHPLRTAGNLAFLSLAIGLFYGLALAAVLIYGAVIDI